jgi:hypothetical protein
MEYFRARYAWSIGWGMIGRRTISHVLLLIGVGILLPYALQFGLAGGPVGGASPATMGEAGSATGPGGNLLLLSIVGLSWLLQTASYFSSLRVGLAGASPGRALLYGLPTGLIALVSIGLIMSPATYAAVQAGSAGAPVLGTMVLLIPLLMVFAIFYTVLTTLIAAALSLMLVVAMVFGTATGNVGLAATLVGGDGGVVVMLLVTCAVTIWLAARLSCTTALMADRRSLNPIGAIRESWRLTWEDQWAIMRYLALIGFGFAVLLAGAMAAIGAGSSAFQQDAQTASQTGVVALGLASVVPLAFLSVMVPAGIYRELTGGDVSAEVFA